MVAIQNHLDVYAVMCISCATRAIKALTEDGDVLPRCRAKLFCIVFSSLAPISDIARELHCWAGEQDAAIPCCDEITAPLIID